MAQKLIRITDRDNVAVALESLPQGSVLEIDGITLTTGSNIPAGHKVALFDIKEGESVVKYGYPIGYAKCEIRKGDWVHTINVHTALKEEAEYTYDAAYAKDCVAEMDAKKKSYASSGIPTIKAYERKNGDIGIRNSIWIVPTVGCVNQISKTLEAWGNENLGIEDGVHAWVHPFGCSQLGDDHENTRKILAGLVKHPNAGGVLVIGLGCENNTMESFKAMLGEVDEERIKFMVCQEETDEIESGKKILSQLAEVVKKDQRTALPMSRLIVGMKCGGSDGFSGITANPLVGRFTNELVAMGGTAILTEVPEMFGAEQVLMNRAENEAVFEDVVSMINGFKHYFTSHGQVVYENPSPGNKMGGITTLEDKSLGCVQKGGRAPVSGVLKYGEKATRKGMNLLTGPGNDIVSTTVQSASGAHMILFTTGRGTPFASPVPTVKISSNSALYHKKGNWIDFNCGELVEGTDLASLRDKLFDYVIAVASGEEVKSEKAGFHDMAIFKQGVTL